MKLDVKSKKGKIIKYHFYEKLSHSQRLYLIDKIKIIFYNDIK